MSAKKEVRNSGVMIEGREGQGGVGRGKGSRFWVSVRILLEEKACQAAALLLLQSHLQEPSHPAVVEIVEEGVSVDEDAHHASRDKGTPPPPVVLCCELEVRQRNHDEARYNGEESEGQEENTVEGVNLRKWWESKRGRPREAIQRRRRHW